MAFRSFFPSTPAQNIKKIDDTIFSFLDPEEKLIACFVCKDWLNSMTASSEKELRKNFDVYLNPTTKQAFIQDSKLIIGGFFTCIAFIVIESMKEKRPKPIWKDFERIKEILSWLISGPGAFAIGLGSLLMRDYPRYQLEQQKSADNKDEKLPYKGMCLFVKRHLEKQSSATEKEINHQVAPRKIG